MTNKIQKKVKDETGSVAVITALALTVLLMFAALALDVGLAYLKSSQLQTACDAASIAGATYIKEHPGCSDCEVKTEVKAYMAANGIDGVQDSDITIKDDVDNPGTKLVTVNKKEDVQTVFAKVMNINTLSPSKKATAAVGESGTGNGEYAIFSGNPNNTLTFTNGTIKTTGGIHTNSAVNVGPAGSVIINNKTNGALSGYLEYCVGGASTHLDGSVTANAAKLMDKTIDIRDDLPYEATIKEKYFPDNFPGTGVSVENSWLNIDGQMTVNDKMIINNGVAIQNGGKLIVNGNVKVTGTLSVNDGAKLIVNGNLEVVNGIQGANNAEIEVYGGLKVINGELNFANFRKATIGKAGSYAVIWCDKSGIDINGGNDNEHYALFYAPEGEVKWDGNGMKVKGSIIAHQIGTNTGDGNVLEVNLPTDDSAWPFSGSSSSGSGGAGSSGKARLVK